MSLSEKKKKKKKKHSRTPDTDCTSKVTKAVALLTLCIWVICMLFVVCFFFFFFFFFFCFFLIIKKILQEYCQSVKQFGSRSGPTFCPNCLQRLSADDKSRHQRGKMYNWRKTYHVYPAATPSPYFPSVIVEIMVITAENKYEDTITESRNTAIPSIFSYSVFSTHNYNVHPIA